MMEEVLTSQSNRPRLHSECGGPWGEIKLSEVKLLRFFSLQTTKSGNVWAYVVSEAGKSEMCNLRDVACCCQYESNII